MYMNVKVEMMIILMTFVSYDIEFGRGGKKLVKWGKKISTSSKDGLNFVSR